ncbi:mechanosensitive ion channel family protein [Jannaschia seohaensis]|uniref:Small-conductance mechanosensitive channel n=1 Tax=Jannaschia seohaensis TaxID=475081 RepID=A0A2Y9BZM3_9RHOB|nr:mechanosensitive ion channel domain-containing protein [Jannaschia seohaensis]PWJ20526.1 small-conductance mechanosensitive channel [Jannaschia seohaensis]SSA44622.1 Small-conductance mechanosensitive channel [Jannaschia seohaensis]
MIRLLAALLLVVATALPLAAEDGAIPPEWTGVQQRATAVLQSPIASEEALNTLRDTLDGWRARFDEARGANAGRIATLRGEIEALGPVPVEGESEPAEVADLRADLRRRLDELLVPQRAAEAAYNAANGLIDETDERIEQMRSEALFRQDALPINPVAWPPALLAVSGWFSDLSVQVTAPFLSKGGRASLTDEGLRIGLLLVVAALLILRSGRWLNAARDRLTPIEATSPLARLGLLGVSVVRLLLPVVGLVALTRSLVVAGAEGPLIDLIVILVPVMGGIVLAANWLGGQAFPPRPDTPSLLPVGEARRREGRLHALTLGVTFALGLAVQAVADTDAAVMDARGVLHFAITLVTGLTLLRLGQLLLSEGRSARDEGEAGIWAQVLRMLGRALLVVGVVGPALIAVGFVNLGTAIVWPTVLSLGLLVLIGVLQNVVFDFYAAITRRTEMARDALAPTLVAFLLAVAAVPAFALIWGVRWHTLTEWWRTFLDGFSIGAFTLSPANLLTFAAVFALGFLATRLVRGVLRTSVLPKTKLDVGGTNAILSGTSYIGITVAALLAVTMAGIDLSGLAIVAGALSVGLGFGLQNIVQNFVSGIILLIERPIKLGDWVAVGGIEGFVREISVRSTRIETFDRQDVIVPNADLIAGVVTNNTLGDMSGRVLIPVGVAYGTDTRKVEAILREIVEAHPMVMLNPAPVITFEGFGADSLDFLCRAVLRDVLWKVIVRSEINHAIAERFAAEGIEIPFAQRDVWLRNPEALRGTPPRPVGGTPARQGDPQETLEPGEPIDIPDRPDPPEMDHP